MATTTKFYATKDAKIARRESDNWDAGGGASTTLPYGLYSGYRYRALLDFSINMSGWTSIVSATFNYKSSSQVSVAFGSDPTMRIDRITTAWSEGSGTGLSSGNAVIYPGPSISTTNNVMDDAPTAESTWGSANITAMMRDVLGGALFEGLRIIGCTNDEVESDSAANVGEFYSRESGADPYIEITYETNRAPGTPVISIAGLGADNVINDVDPTLSFTITDPDSGDLLTQHQLEVSTTSAFTAGTLVDTSYVTGSFASGTVVSHTTPVLTRGTTYYARARAYDGTVWGAWSATKTFKIASLPTVALTEPSAAGRLGRITYDAGSGWVSPRLNVAWSFTCPDGGTQASYQVQVAADAAGAPTTPLVYDGPVMPESATRALVVPADLTEGQYVHVRVTCVCSHGVSTTVAYLRVRVRWGVVTHAYNMGAGLTSLNLTTLDVTDETTGGSGRVTMEYATVAAAPPTPPAGWQGSIAAAGLNQYLWYRAWLLAWGASPAVSPTLNELKVTYSSIQIVPDKWERQDPTNEAGDSGAYVYGTKSFRMLGKGSKHTAWQEVPVNTDTWYVLSGRIQSLGDSGAYISLASDSLVGADLVATPPLHVTGEFEDTDKSRVVTLPVFSGSNTSIFIRLNVTGGVGTMAWFDALKLEASTVVTPWSPGYIADAVVLDSGGLQIDGLAGGIFRLRGGAGGARDELTLSDHGLKWGGDTELASPSPGVLTVNGVGLGGASHSHPFDYGASGSGVPVMGGHGSATYSGVPAFEWWQIGRLVFMRVSFSFGTAGSGTSGISVTFPGAPPAGNAGGVAGDRGGTGVQRLIARMQSGGTSLVFLNITVMGAAGASNLLGQDLVAGAGFNFNFAYLASTDAPPIIQVPIDQPAQGTTFPATPTPDQRFYRTDLDMDFFWDAGLSKWLSTAVYQIDFPALGNQAATISDTGRVPVPSLRGGSDILLVDYDVASYNVSGGTALAPGTHQWLAEVRGGPVAGSGVTTGIATKTISSGASSTWRHDAPQAIAAANQLLAGRLYLYQSFTKTGTPGNLYLHCTVTYRIVG